jgi:hypothetical protein
LELRSGGSVDEQLVSLVDLAPTMLSITGIDIPDHLQGQPFLGPKKSSPRKFVFAARDRMDSEYDRVRCVTDGHYMYLRNYMPEKPYYQDIAYRLQQPSMKAIINMRDKGGLNETQMLWFRDSKPTEEFYDCNSDPHQLKNLKDDPRHKRKMAELRKQLEAWQLETGDLSEKSESEMVKAWWSGKATPPETSSPTIIKDESKIVVTTQTKGASIGYRFDAKESWRVYQEPLTVTGPDTLDVVAQRIGYTKSDTVRLILPN